VPNLPRKEQKKMRSGCETTYIMLDRGCEDVDLLHDIRRVIVDLKIEGLKEAIERYPDLMRLKALLIEETQPE